MNHSQRRFGKKLLRAQVSVEYILILVIGFVLLSASLYFIFIQSQTISYAAETKKGIAFGSLLVSRIDEVALLSMFSKTTLSVTLPSDAVELRVLNYTTANLSYDLVLSSGETSSRTQFLFVSKYPFVLGNCSQSVLSQQVSGGQKQVVVESCGSYVAVALK
jgi:hypothetical protein